MGGWRRIGGYPGWVGMNRLCPLMLEYGPNASQFSEDCFTEVGWHATFDIFCPLAGFFYEPVLGCDIRFGDVFAIVE